MPTILASVFPLFINLEMPLVLAPWQVPTAQMHCHSVPVAILARSRLIVQAQHTDIHLEPNQILTIPENVAYRYLSPDGGNIRWAALLVRHAVFRAASQSDAEIKIANDADDFFSQTQICRYEATADYIHAFRRLITAPDTTRAVRACQELSQALSITRRDYIPTITPRPKPSTATIELLDQIVMHMPRTVGLDALRSKLGSLPARSIDNFKRYTGLPPQQFLRCRRAHLALYLAIRGVSLKIVAQDTGYSNPAHLTASFYKFFGMSPSALVSRVRMRAARLTI